MFQKEEVHRSLVPHLSDAGKIKDTPLSCLQPNGVVVSGSDRKFFPCSGNGNGQSWNNRGSNGNYWSSSLNSATNGRNLNFNSGGVNPQNNNNRFNGFSVRPVQHSLLNILFMMLTYDFDKRKTAFRFICGLLRCAKAQVSSILCKALGRRPKVEYGTTMRRHNSSDIQTSAVEMLHRGLSKETRDIRCNVPRQDSTSSVLQLYARALRAHIYCRHIFMHQGTRYALWHQARDIYVSQGVEKLAAEMLCHAHRYTRIFYAHRPQTIIGYSRHNHSKDVITSSLGRHSRYRLSDMANRSYRHDQSQGGLYIDRRQIKLGWIRPSKEYAPSARRYRLADRKPHITVVLKCLYECFRPICEAGPEVSLLWALCRRCGSDKRRQRMVVISGADDRALPKRRAWIGDTQWQATHQRGTQRRGISRRIHQTLEDVCITSYIGTDRKENRHHGFHKAKDGCEKCQFISWNFPTYRLLQNQEEHIHAA